MEDPPCTKHCRPSDPHGDRVHLVLGPWNHGQGRGTGRGIGQIAFEGDTATWFRRTIMQPFLDYYLKDGPKPDTPRVLVYETGVDQWHRYDSWPRACESGCLTKSRPLYLQANGRLGFDPPAAGKAAQDRYDEYVSDPAKPVPYRLLPTLDSGAPDSTWGEWLVDDQRFAGSRTDVLVYQTEPLTQPLRVAGQPWAHLSASTSGTDSDWVVKIIDVWPDQVRRSPEPRGLSTDVVGGHPARPLPPGPRQPKAARIQQGAAVHDPAAECQPYLPAGPPHHGADPVELVSAL